MNSRKTTNSKTGALLLLACAPACLYGQGGILGGGLKRL